MERLGGRVERVEIGRFKAADDHGNVVGTIVEFKEACFVHTVNGNLIDIEAARQPRPAERRPPPGREV